MARTACSSSIAMARCSRGCTRPVTRTQRSPTRRRSVRDSVLHAMRVTSYVLVMTRAFLLLVVVACGSNPKPTSKSEPRPVTQPKPKASAIADGWWLKADGCPAGLERSEEHTSELQSLAYLVCRLLLEKKKAVGIL